MARRKAGWSQTRTGSKTKEAGRSPHQINFYKETRAGRGC